MGLTYEKDHMNKVKTPTQRIIDGTGPFPGCKGLYPDCPEEPSLENKMCKTCPKTEGMK